MTKVTRKSWTSTRYFPFSPGIPWKLQNGLYVIPQITQDTWNSVLDGKDLVVLAYGGLLESFASLSVVEALSRNEPSKRLFWAGNQGLKRLVFLHGKATYDAAIDDIGNNYPVPLFFDQGTKAYFNVLNNYRTRTSYYLQHPWHDKRPVFEQIFSNSMLNWDKSYIPVLNRNTAADNWIKSNKLRQNKRYVLLFPEPTGLSSHNINCLGWGPMELREFAALVRRFDVDVVVFGQNHMLLYDSKFKHAPIDIDLIVELIKNAGLILANDIDILLLGLATSNAALMAPILKDEFDLHKNAEFIGSDNVILTSSSVLTPMEAYTLCEGIL